MINKEIILKKAKEKGLVRTRDFSVAHGVSRQYVSSLISQLVSENKLLKIGTTRSAVYVTAEYLDTHQFELPTRFAKKFLNKNLEEHVVLHEIERHFASYVSMPENIKSVFAYTFSEMLNNAIEHSQSKKIHVVVEIKNNKLIFEIEDFGIGVFRNIIEKRKLNNELEAIQDLLKGKMTTAPKLHSGEGIFFSSKMGDEFVLDSFGQQLIVDNKLDDIFVPKVPGQKQGTRVRFCIGMESKRHLTDIFAKYANIGEDSDYGFDKTEIRIKLYVIGGINISRSQARRVLSGLEKFNIIAMDYDGVPMVGQAFADEIYRVFKDKYPKIKIQSENMNESVRFMVERAIKERRRRSVKE